jgi:hypothetical protein
VVRHITVYTIEVKTESTVQNPHSGYLRWAWCFNFFTTQAVQCPIHRKRGPDPHINNVDLTGVTEWQGRRATTLRRVPGIYSIDEIAQQTSNTAQVYMEEANQIRHFNPQHFSLFTRSFIAF